MKLFFESRIPSREHDLRLIEVVSYALHQIGIHLYQLNLCLHKGGPEEVHRVDTYVGELSSALTSMPFFNIEEYRNRLKFFIPPNFPDVDIYPNGRSELVGYWAENRILGGVPAFDRHIEMNRPHVMPNVYWNSDRKRVTDRLCQLSDGQQQAIVDFLTSEDPERTGCPLPLLPTRANRVWVSSWLAASEHNIYKDLWERKPPSNHEEQYLARMPQDEIDHPESKDFLRSVLAFYGDNMPGENPPQELDGGARKG